MYVLCTYPLEELILRLGVLSEDSAPYMIEIVLTFIPMKGGIVDSDVKRFLYSPG